MSSMLNALLAAHKKSIKDSEKVGVKVKKTKKEELFDYSILEKGGVSQYTFTYEGKKKTLFVSLVIDCFGNVISTLLLRC